MKKLTRKEIKKIISDSNNETPDVGSFLLEIYEPKEDKVIESLFFKDSKELYDYIDKSNIQKAIILRYVGWQIDCYIGDFFEK